MVYVFDIEVYSNFFSVIFKNIKTKEIQTFTIHSNRNDLNNLYKFINDAKKWFVGYNSHYYDNQILNYIYRNYKKLNYSKNTEICSYIKEVSDDIIHYDQTKYKYNLPFQGIDLMRVGNLDHKPLKLVAVNLKWPKIQDLPIEPEAEINDDQINLIFKYNLNDVEITEALYEKCKKAIKFRWEISKKYGVNVMDESDSGISNKLLEKIFSEALSIPIPELKKMQTNRTVIPFKDVIFDDIEFKTATLRNFLCRLELQSYVDGEKSTFKEKIILDGTAYQLGIGGIHSDDRPGLFNKTNDMKLIDADIASMYPSLIINKRLAPEHLGDGFIDKYDEIRDTRVSAKHAKDMTVSDGLKIVLNATYGKTNSKHHWLRDTKVTLQVTINGQLYLLMLIEDLGLRGFDVISANTDGIVTKVPIERESEYKQICAEWEKKTDFVLEYTEYEKYARRDVNNYITIKPGNKTKVKGDFETETPLKKGFDAPIVAIALYEYYVNGINIETTIRGHQNIYDFCIARKSDKKFTNEFHYLKDHKDLQVDELQRTNRYYISTNGGKLYKHDKIADKRTDTCVGYKVTLFNDYFESDDYKIDYSYYINRARKITEVIENKQLTLF